MISAVIVSYRTGPLLWECLASVLAADEVGEVILVDNGNPDDTLSRLRAMSAASAKLRLITGQGNIGFARACNLGARKARGDHLLFLNPDAVLPAGGAGRLRDAGESSGARFWAAGPRLENPDGSEQRGSRRAILTPWNAFVDVVRLDRLAPNHPYFKRFNAHDRPLADGVSTVPCLSGAAFLMPRATWDALAGFDERFFLHVEDIDLFLRLGKAGGSALFVPDVRVVHHKSSSEVDPLMVERRKRQSLNLYFSTHFKGVYPWGFLALMRALLWAGFAVRFVKIRLRRRA